MSDQTKNLQIKKLGGAPAPQPAQQMPLWNPPSINSIEDTGLNLLTVADLALKVLYLGGVMDGHDL